MYRYPSFYIYFLSISNTHAHAYGLFCELVEWKLEWKYDHEPLRLGSNQSFP